MGLDDGLLPGETGWFAVPFTVDQPAYVRVELDTYEASFEPRLTMGQAILAVEGRDSWPFATVGGPAPSPMLEAAHQGEELARRCEDATTGWSLGSGGSRMSILLSPGEVLWVGLAAYQWSQTHDAFLTLSAQALLSQGEPRVGTRVDAVDPYHEAMSAGTRVQALSLTAQPAAGSAERSWRAEHHGLFALSAWRQEGNGRVTLELPDMAPVSTRIGEHGLFAAAHRAGDLRVVLDELEGPLVGSEWVQATAFFADIDIPGDVAFVYPSEG